MAEDSPPYRKGIYNSDRQYTQPECKVTDLIHIGRQTMIDGHHFEYIINYIIMAMSI